MLARRVTGGRTADGTTSSRRATPSGLMRTVAALALVAGLAATGGPRVADVLHGRDSRGDRRRVAAAGGGVLVIIGTVLAALAVPPSCATG